MNVGTKRFAQAASEKATPDYEPNVSHPSSRGDLERQDTVDSSLKSRVNEKQRTVDEGRIRQRAYELYAEGGFQDGNTDGNWFAAEREIEEQED
jgi:hypothetical protein